MFLTIRQGDITIRAIQDSSTPTILSGIHITDSEIASIESYSAFDQEHSPEYDFVQINSTDGTTSPGSPVETPGNREEPATLPSELVYTYDLTDWVWSNNDNIAANILNRVSEACCRVPESLVLRCAGLRLAQLAPGDIVTLTTTRTQSRRNGRDGWQGEAAVVIEVSTDWNQGSVRLRLLVYPPTGEQFE